MQKALPGRVFGLSCLKSHSKEVDAFLTCSSAIAESQVISFDYRSEASVAEARGDRDTISQREVLSL